MIGSRKNLMPENQLLEQFITSQDTLWVYKEGRAVFQSRRRQLIPLLEYISGFVLRVKEVTVFDRIGGDAAALLLKKAFCLEVYSPLASQPAVQSLEGFGIDHHFSKIVPYILNQEGNDICLMEKLSLGKSPNEFYQAIREKSLAKCSRKEGI